MAAIAKTNPYFLSFNKDVQTRFNKDTAQMSHGDWMCENTFLNKRPFSFDRYPFQKQIADDMHPNLCCIKPSQVGLALDLDTPMLTTLGWKTMGTLIVGDKVYDENGKVCNVDYVSPIYLDRDCYELKFDDGQSLVADGQHRWFVNCLDTHELNQIVTTKAIYDSPYNNWAVPLSCDLTYLDLQEHLAKEPLPSNILNQFQLKIVDVSLVESRPVRCISVSSDSHLFLAGSALIPTHNTEIQIRKALTIMRRVESQSLIYTMPNERMYKRIAKARILPIVENDRAFRDVSKPAMDLIPIGNNFMYVTGSTEGDATSIDADYLFHDEVDLMPQGMMSLFSSRLQGSDIRVKQSFSTPKWDGYGIDLMFASSDQHEYMIKCRKCNTHQIPQFTKEFVHIPGGCMDIVEDYSELDRKMLDSGLIDLNNIKVKCRKCHHKLDLSDYKRREWVSRHPQRGHSRGYRVRTFSTHRLTPKYVIEELFKAKDRDNVAGWQNTVLGDTATTGDRRLSKSQISEQLKGETCILPPPGTPVYVGIDVGVTCNITLGVEVNGGNGVNVFKMYTCPADRIEAEVMRLMEEFNIAGGGMDKYPYTPTANSVRAISKGKIIPVEYSTAKELTPEKDVFGQVTTIKVNRTISIDKVANGIRNKTWELRGYAEQTEVVTTHLMDMVRDEPTEGQATWVKLNGSDHYFHSLAYLGVGISYRELSLHLQGHTSVANDPIAMNVFDDNFSNFSHCDDLIGYSSGQSSNKKIITRY